MMINTKILGERVLPTSIGRRIRFARESACLSQTHLGGLLSPPKSGASISEIESDKVVVAWETVIQIAEALCMSLDFFTNQYCPECLRSYTRIKGKEDE